MNIDWENILWTLETELKHKEDDCDYNNGVHDAIEHVIELIEANTNEEQQENNMDKMLDDVTESIEVLYFPDTGEHLRYVRAEKLMKIINKYTKEQNNGKTD